MHGVPDQRIYDDGQRRLPRPADGRLRFTNYGKGVLYWWGNTDAGRFVNTAGWQGMVSADAYFFTDPDNQDTSQGQCFYNGCNTGGNLTYDQAQRAYNYALIIKRLRDLDALDGQRQPIIGQIEMAKWETDRGSTEMTPAMQHGAFWQSIIGGARGVDYFPFSWGSRYGSTDHVQRSTVPQFVAMQNQAKADNDLATQLAPVLNDSSVTTGWSISSGNNAMIKWHDGHFYAFAGNKDNQAKTATISIPCVGDATAVKLDQTTSQTIPVQSGTFSDNFADGNTIHIYRIDGGTTCGLPTN